MNRIFGFSLLRILRREENWCAISLLCSLEEIGQRKMIELCVSLSFPSDKLIVWYLNLPDNKCLWSFLLKMKYSLQIWLSSFCFLLHVTILCYNWICCFLLLLLPFHISTFIYLSCPNAIILQNNTDIFLHIYHHWIRNNEILLKILEARSYNFKIDWIFCK